MKQRSPDEIEIGFYTCKPVFFVLLNSTIALPWRQWVRYGLSHYLHAQKLIRLMQRWSLNNAWTILLSRFNNTCWIHNVDEYCSINSCSVLTKNNNCYNVVETWADNSWWKKLVDGCQQRSSNNCWTWTIVNNGCWQQLSTGCSTTSLTGCSTTSLTGCSTTSLTGCSTTSLTGCSTTLLTGCSTTSLIGCSTTSLTGCSTTSLTGCSTTSLTGCSTTLLTGCSTTSLTGCSTTSLTGCSTSFLRVYSRLSFLIRSLYHLHSPLPPYSFLFV